MVLSARLAVLSLVVLSQFALSSSFTVTTPRLLLAPSILSSNPQRHSSIPPALSLAMSEEKPSRVGAKTDYMKKIPSHLQGIAVRRKQQVVQEYTSGKLSEEEAETARIQKELEEDSDETFDMAMEILELDQVDVPAPQSYHAFAVPHPVLTWCMSYQGVQVCR
eukprot:305004-Rhodomonas_salina.4